MPATLINKYAGKCPCGAHVPAAQGSLLKIEGRWQPLCADCAKSPAKVNAYSAPTQTSLAPAPSADEPYTLLSGHEASPYQAAVFDHFRTSRSSAIVKAVAGSGKTTTIKNAIRYLPSNLFVQLFAFNVEAAGQLKAALVEIDASNRVNAGTFHSVGYRAVARHLNAKLEPDAGKCRKLFRAKTNPLIDAAYGAFAAQLVAYAKGEGIGALVPDTDTRWWDLVEHHGLYLDAEEVEGMEVSEAEAVSYARQLLIWSNEAAKLDHSVDYDDLLYLVVLWKLRLWQNDVVICDEAQDTNPVRRAMLRLALKPTGRLYAVGDPKQSIYGFTGASTDAMDLIAREFNTKELPLMVSYRCATAVVERAQTWVPYIEAAPTADEGEVLDDVPLHEALALLGPKDAILCRQTKPLVSLAYGLIARGRACRIMGKEIGQGLVNLVEAQRARGIKGLVTKLETWKRKQMARFIAKGDERRAEGVADRVDCLLVIIEALPEGERTIPALVARITALFDDNDTGVLTLATAHKSKGQEWQQVAILRPDLMPSKGARQEWQYEQEINLMYVAATRAKHTLIYVRADDEQIEATP